MATERITDSDIDWGLLKKYNKEEHYSCLPEYELRNVLLKRLKVDNEAANLRDQIYQLCDEVTSIRICGGDISKLRKELELLEGQFMGKMDQIQNIIQVQNIFLKRTRAFKKQYKNINSIITMV